MSAIQPDTVTAEWILERAAQSILPPERHTVDEYAERHRMLANEGGGYVGRWRNDEAPYLRAPMQCLTSLDYMTVVVVGPGQSGKTEIAQNQLLHSVAVDPADTLWYMQNEASLEAFVKGRINPMIDAHEVMRANQGLRPVDDSLHFKRFRGMRAEFLSATMANLINKSAGRIVADEYDAYAAALGDAKALLDVRRQTYGAESMLLVTSHPDLARGLRPERDWTAGVMSLYGDSDRQVWWWKCPHCDGYSSPCPIASRVMTLEYPADAPLDVIEREARMLCPVCGALIEDHHRRAMNRTGVWVGEGQEIDVDGRVTGKLVKRMTAGFWIVGIMSPFNASLGGVGGLARARAKAEREKEITGDDTTLRQVVVKQWGIPYAPPKTVDNIDAMTLAERAEADLELGKVPEGVRFLTAWADVQMDRFEWLVRGWGVRGESWVVAKGRYPENPKATCTPATAPEDWDGLLEAVALRRFPLATDPARAMAIRGFGIDSGGIAGVTQQAYDAWNRWRARKVARRLGIVGGRDAWSVILTKGAAHHTAPKLQVTYPDTDRRDRRAKAGGTVPVAQFNPNLFKDDLAGQFGRAEPGPWYVHLPAGLLAAEPPHPWFEQVTSERRDAVGRWEKETKQAPNEALDLMVGAHVLAHLHGLTRINWERPPAWAAPWDKNLLISAVATDDAKTAGPPKPAKPIGQRLA